MRRALGLAVSIWALGVLYGLWASSASPAVPPSVDGIPSNWITIRHVLLNNFACLAAALGGCLTYGLSSVVTLAASGLALGMTVGTTDLSWKVLSLLLLPHGIIEIPALWMAGAIGIKRPPEPELLLKGALSLSLATAGAAVVEVKAVPALARYLLA